jgi:hypothetical protein
MRNIWPLSERFDLKYVRRRHFPDTWTGRLSLGAVLAVGAFVAYAAISGDERAFSSGALTYAHAMFADDCTQCHAPDPGRVGYWLPAQDSACLRCHVAPLHNPHQSMFRGDATIFTSQVGPVEMSGDCSACHVEHRGADTSLNLVHDRMCIACHRDLSRFGRVPPPPIVEPGLTPAPTPPAPEEPPADDAPPEEEPQEAATPEGGPS